MSHKEPMFNIAEPAPLWLAGVFLCIHAFTLIIPSSIEHFIAYYGILRPLNTLGVTGLSHGVGLWAHGFLHGSWTHVLVNSAMSIAFGVVTIRGIKLRQTTKGRAPKATLKFLCVFLMGVIGGGLAQWLWWTISGGSGHPVGTGALGASGGASALFATAAWAMGGRPQLLKFGLGWTLINIVFVVIGPSLGMNIAWAAHLGGYLAGAIVAPVWVLAKSTKFSVTR